MANDYFASKGWLTNYAKAEDSTGAWQKYVAEVERSEMDNFNTPDLDQGADSILRPGETLDDFDVTFRKPNAKGGFQQLVSNTVDGSRPGYKGGSDAKTGMGFQKGNTMGIDRDLKGKPSLNVGGKNQYTPRTAKEIQAIIDANPEYITRKNFYEPTEIMKQKGMKKLLTYTDTENPDVVFKRTGPPEPDPAKQTVTNTKRTAAKKRLEGRIIQLKSPKGYQVHHIMPLAGGEDLRTGDYAVVSKEMNAKMSKYDRQINKLVNEAYGLDFNETPNLKRLDEINNSLFDILKTVKKDLPKEYKGLLGFNKLTPVLDTFDDKGKQVFNAEPQGIDYKKSIQGSRGDKVRDIKKSNIQDLVNKAPKFDLNKQLNTIIAKGGKKGKAAAQALAILTGTTVGAVADDGSEGLSGVETAAIGGAAAGTLATKTGRKVLSNLLSAAGVPASIAFNAIYGIDPESSLDRTILSAEAALAPMVVKDAIRVTDKIKNPLLKKAAQFVTTLNPKYALKAARYASPVGIASLAGEAIYNVGKLGYEDQKRFNALSPEEQAAERAEQKKFASDIEGS